MVKVMTNIDILMMDGCTTLEAEKHLQKGTTVFAGDDFEEHFGDYMDEWGIDEDEQADYRRMVDEKTPVPDWSIVEHDGLTWYIMYVL